MPDTLRHSFEHMDNREAGIYGSDAYKQLEAVMANLPDFRLVVNQVKLSAKRMKGLTIAKMEKYIRKHDDENGSKMKEFDVLCGKTENEDGFTVHATYGEIKQRFFETYSHLM